jgi:endonuclease III
MTTTMKNATKHAEELKSLHRKLLREGKPEPRQPQEPLKALVRGAMSFDVPDDRAETAMRAIEKEFVDLNELRVATDLEIQELLGTRYPSIERRVAMITLSLNRIFEREHTLSLERLRTISRRDARQFLRELPALHPFVEAFVMLMSFEGHAIPVDDTMLSWLRDKEIAGEEATLDEVQRFLEHQLKAEECFSFFTLARRASQHSGSDGEARKKKSK